MAKIGNPSTKLETPLAEKDPSTALEIFQQGIAKSIDVCFPACVYAYYRDTHTVDVMPLVKQGFYNGQWHYVNREIIKGISIRNIQCGGFTIDIPVYVGDTGWVFSSDRDSSLVKQKGALTNSVLAKDRPLKVLEEEYQQKPNQPTIHSFQHGFFLPDNWGAVEINRYKDCPATQVGDGLYIGTSFDTRDEKADLGDEDTYQKGEEYEANPSASIVIQKEGGVTIGASGKKVSGKHSYIKTAVDGVELSTEDEIGGQSISCSLTSSKGLTISQIGGEGKGFSCELQGGEFSLQVYSLESDEEESTTQSGNTRAQNSKGEEKTEKMLSVTYKDGELNVSTAGDVNMRVGGGMALQTQESIQVMTAESIDIQAEESVNVNVKKEAYVIGEDIRVLAKERASVVSKEINVNSSTLVNINAGDTINIGSVNTTNINGGEKVNLASEGINVTAAEDINIVTGNRVTIMAKEKNATIDILTLNSNADINISATGPDSDVSVSSEEGDVYVGAKNAWIEAEEEVYVGAENAKIEAEGEVYVGAKNAKIEAEGEVYVGAGNAKIEASEQVTVIGKYINLESDNLRFLGKKIGIDSKTGIVHGA